MFNENKTHIISTKEIEPTGLISIKNYMGRPIFSKSGAFVGKVKDVALLNEQVIGVLAKSNKHQIFLNKENFENDTDEAIMLKIEPITLLLGKTVFDADGKNIGKVIEVIRHNSKNDYSGIVVKKGFFAKPIEVQVSDIDVQKANIILNKVVDGK